MSSVCQCLLGEPSLVVTLREGMLLLLAVAYANVYGGFIAVTSGDFFVQPNQFDPESAPEEVQTLWLQQGILE